MSPILAVDIAADGRWIAISGIETGDIVKRKISVFAYLPYDNTYQEIQSFSGEGSGAYAVAISDNHEWLLWGEGDKTSSVRIYRYNGSTFNSHQNLSLSGAISSLDLTDDAVYLAIGIVSFEIAIYQFNGSSYEPFQKIDFGGSDLGRRVSITGNG